MFISLQNREPFRLWRLWTGVCLLASVLPAFHLGAAEIEQLVLLTNGNVLSGMTEEQGDYVVLKHADGSELRIPQLQIAYSAATIEDLYRFRVNQRSFRSTAIHAEDARWCLRNGLIDQAEAELKNLQALDPSNPDGIRLQRQIAAARSPRATAPQVYTPLLPEPPVPTEKPESLPTNLTPAAIAEFATRVQPMLINRCGNAGCHRTGADTALQLTHLGVNVRVSARMTQRNLASTLSHINLDDPLTSELLVYLTTAHADNRYEPVGRATQSAEATLRAWLVQLGRNSQPAANPAPSAVSRVGFHQTTGPVAGQMDDTRRLDEPVPAGFAVDADGELIYDPEREANPTTATEPAAEGDESFAAWPPPVVRAPATTQELPSRPTRLPAVANPFSADLFNRRHQVLRPSAQRDRN